MTATYDLIVIGGGIGGSGLASVMAKAGKSVLLLEKSEVYEDRVRGEWISPWGVAESKRLGLYDVLIGAGGHHLDRHITFDEGKDPQVAQSAPLPLSIFVPDIPGPLCIGHPHHCQTLYDYATRWGAKTLRGVDVTDLQLTGTRPLVRYRNKGKTHEATARLIVGADGRTSMVRDQAKIALHQDKPHHMFTGLLIEGAPGWDEKLQAIGTEGDFAFLAFPQGHGRVRVYGSFALEDRARFAGPAGPRKFLDSFNMSSAPPNKHLVAAKPAGPLLTYFNNDSWTDRPYAENVVLIGDAAGWNDPIIGLGLSITYRDVRIVSDILKSTDDWNTNIFAPYGEERSERMRRLRFAAALTSSLDAEFGEAAAKRRQNFFERSAQDPSLGIHAVTVMAGPESVGPEFFTPEHRNRVLNG
jgi:2-polyprenyl-6-methoxyphenol hydroxylase-like FAD-dependent oxidoreductase